MTRFLRQRFLCSTVLRRAQAKLRPSEGVCPSARPWRAPPCRGKLRPTVDNQESVRILSLTNLPILHDLLVLDDFGVARPARFALERALFRHI